MTLNHVGTFAAMSNGVTGFVLWNLTTGAVTKFLEPFGTMALVFTADDRFVAALSMYGVVFLWDMSGHEILQTNRMPEGEYDVGLNMERLALYNNASRYVVAGDQIAVGPLTENSQPEMFDFRTDQFDFARSVAVNPANDVAAVAVDGEQKTMALFDLSNKRRLNTLSGHTGTIRLATFSPDGSLLLDASDDGTIFVWGD